MNIKFVLNACLLSQLCLGCTSSEPAAPTHEAIARQAWKIIGEEYFDPDMEGLDWEAVGRRYIGRAKSADSQLDLYFNTLMPMASLLDSSHVGVSPPRPSTPAVQGSAMAGARTGNYIEGCLGMYIADGKRGISSRFTEVEPTSVLFSLGIRAGWRLLGFEAVDTEKVDEVRIVVMATDGKRTEFVLSSQPARGTQVLEELRLWKSLARVGGQPYTVMRFPAIGASLRIGRFGTLPSVTDVEPGSPAEKAGIQPGSEIRELNTRPLGEDRFAYSGTLAPEGASLMQFQTELVCKPASDLPTREARILEGDILYLRFNRFEDGVVSWLAAELSRTRPQAVLLDLRRNAGGDLNEVRRVMGLFLGADKALGTFSPRRGADYVARTVTTRTKAFDGKMAVLISPMSASGAEVTASALKAHGRARLFGESTQGSVLLSRIFPLADGGSVKVAIMDFHGVDGGRLENVGIPVDVFAPPTLEAIRAGRDPAIERALSDLAGPSPD